MPDLNTLIPVASSIIGTDTVKTVDARKLHTFLEVRTAFKDWIARRVEEYEFLEGKDFCSFLSETSAVGGRPAKEYALTLDMAKELAMVERTAKGKEARLYFIECERIAKAAQQPVVQDVRIQALIHALCKLDAIESEQREQAERMRAIEARQEAELYGFRYFSVLAYANLCKAKIDTVTASKIGKLAVKACLAQGATVGKIFDQRYGTVGTYPEEILKEIFDGLGCYKQPL